MLGSVRLLPALVVRTQPSLSSPSSVRIARGMEGVAGAQPAFDLNYRLVRRGGRLNVFSWHKGGDRRVDLGAWHGMGIEVVNASPGIAPDFARVFARTVPMMERGVFDLKPLITHVMPPERAQELFEIAAHQTDGYIKGVVRW